MRLHRIDQTTGLKYLPRAHQYIQVYMCSYNIMYYIQILMKYSLGFQRE